MTDGQGTQGQRTGGPVAVPLPAALEEIARDFTAMSPRDRLTLLLDFSDGLPDLPERYVAGNLNGPEAASLAKDIGARMVIPCHYEMFEFNTAPPDEFIESAQGLGQPHRVLRSGGQWSSAELK